MVESVMPFSIILTAGIIYLLSWFSHKFWVPKWESFERNFRLYPSWVSQFISTGILGVVTAAFVAFQTENVYISVLFGFTAFILAFCGSIDFQEKRVPYEFTRAGIIGSALGCALTLNAGYGYSGLTLTGNLLYDSYLQIAAWAGVVLVCLLLVMFGQLGGADVNVMWIVGFAYVGFLGFMEVMFLFLIAYLIQSFAFFIRRIRQGKAKGGERSLPLIPALAVVFISGVAWYLVN